MTNEPNPLEERARKAYENKKKADKKFKETRKEDQKAYMLTYNEEYYKTHKEEMKAHQQKYREAHKEDKKAYDKSHYIDIREEKLAYCKEYNEANKDKRRAYDIKCKLGTSKGRFFGLNKRDKTEACEICLSIPRKRLYYHHWDDNNPSKGVWVCAKCHHTICEAEDSREQNISSGCTQRYLNLKSVIDANPPAESVAEEIPASLEGKAKKAYEHMEKHVLGIKGKQIHGLNKRDLPEACEICFKTNTRLGYHHWDTSNLNKGVWVCAKCHHTIAEAEDSRERNTYLGYTQRYTELKDSINAEYDQAKS